MGGNHSVRPPIRQCTVPRMNDLILNHDGTLREAPKQPDPFQLFEIEHRAVIDAAKLRPKFLALSRAIHPDRFQAAGGEQLARAEAWAGVLNRSWALIKDNRERVLWLLAKAGAFNIDSSEAAGTANVPQDLLMEVFELRELLEEADGAAPLEPGVKQRLTDARTEMAGHLASVNAGWQEAAVAYDSEGPEAAALIVSDLVTRQRFLERLLREIDRVLADHA